MVVSDLRGRALPFGPWSLPEMAHVVVGSGLSFFAGSHLGVFGLAAGGAATIGGLVVSRSVSSSRRRQHAEVQTPAADAQSVLFDEELTLSGPVAAAALAHAGLDRRIGAVRAAVRQLDAEWLSYEQDLEAYFLTKPVLRDRTVYQTAVYNDALFELRELADALGAGSLEQQVRAAEDAAEAALVAWGDANDYAAQVGISDRSPVERAALRRLHGLVGQLADPGTPRQMWSSLSQQIERELTKLTTVPAAWSDLQRHPAIAHRPVAQLGSKTAPA